MITNLRRSVVTVVVFTAFFGFLYAFAGTGVAQTLFHRQANGSISANGSPLIGQDWSKAPCPGHPLGSCVFQGRPDNLGPYSDVGRFAGDSPVGHPGDNPLVANGVAGGSGATNLGPRSQELLTYTEWLVRYWRHRGVTPTPDLVTTSGSGLDPDISPQDAVAQIPMVAAATGLSPSSLRLLIAQHTHGEQLGFLGAAYVNVLELNEGLAALRSR
jgi:K+-transporting ATPase ATPase C chain